MIVGFLSFFLSSVFLLYGIYFAKKKNNNKYMKYGYEELNSISTMRITNDIESKWESAHTHT